MVVVTKADIFQQRHDDILSQYSNLYSYAKGKGPSGELTQNRRWYKLRELINNSNVLVWGGYVEHDNVGAGIYWINKFVNPIPGASPAYIYLHYYLQLNGDLKEIQMNDNTIDPLNALDNGEIILNIYTDSIESLFIPCDSYKWLLKQEIDEINSIERGNLGYDTNVLTFEQITFVSISAQTSSQQFKPITKKGTKQGVGVTGTTRGTGAPENVGITGSTGPTGPSSQPDSCKDPTAIFLERRQDFNRSRYVQPDINTYVFKRVINARDYTADVVFYYKLSEMYQSLQIYNYIYYVVDIPSDNELNKLYVRIDPYGNTNSVKSSVNINPKSYPNIPWGTKSFNIFTIDPSNNSNINNLFIPIIFYGALLTQEYEELDEGGCFYTFQTLTYEDYSNINDYLPLDSSQINQAPTDDSDPDISNPPQDKDPDISNPPDNPSGDINDQNSTDPNDNYDIVVQNGDGTLTNTSTSQTSSSSTSSSESTASPNIIVSPVINISQGHVTPSQFIIGLALLGLIIYCIKED